MSTMFNKYQILQCQNQLRFSKFLHSPVFDIAVITWWENLLDFGWPEGERMVKPIRARMECLISALQDSSLASTSMSKMRHLAYDLKKPCYTFWMSSKQVWP